MNLFSLADRTALVTGASSGLGRHFAKVLSKAGADVVVAARRMDRLESLAAEISKSGGRALPVEMDVTSDASVSGAFAEIKEAIGRPVTSSSAIPACRATPGSASRARMTGMP